MIGTMGTGVGGDGDAMGIIGEWKTEVDDVWRLARAARQGTALVVW
jgi:hypothetical protein